MLDLYMIMAIVIINLMLTFILIIPLHDKIKVTMTWIIKINYNDHHEHHGKKNMMMMMIIIIMINLHRHYRSPSIIPISSNLQPSYTAPDGPAYEVGDPNRVFWIMVTIQKLTETTQEMRWAK